MPAFRAISGRLAKTLLKKSKPLWGLKEYGYETLREGLPATSRKFKTGWKIPSPYGYKPVTKLRQRLKREMISDSLGLLKYKPRESIKYRSLAAKGRLYEEKMEPAARVHVDSPRVKKRVGLSKQQWTRFIERHIGDKPGMMQKQDVMEYEPPKEYWTRLFPEELTMEQKATGLRREDFPFDFEHMEGALQYQRGKSGYPLEKGKPPMEYRAGEPMQMPPATDVLTPEGYVRREYKPIRAGVLEASGRAIKWQKEEEALEASRMAKAKAQQKRGIPEESVKAVSRSSGRSIEELEYVELNAGMIYASEIKGLNTLAGRQWDRLRKGASGRFKVPHVKDYFMRCYMRFKLDPKGFEKQFPREANLLKGYDQVYPLGEM